MAVVEVEKKILEEVVIAYVSDYPTLVRAGGSDHNQELKSQNLKFQTSAERFYTIIYTNTSTVFIKRS